jgi:nitronate monooxygenase
MNKHINKQKLIESLRLPVIGAPLFIVSTPKLVIEQCKSGIIGAFPALNARKEDELESWLKNISQELDSFKKNNPEKKVAPYAVNQIVHHSNTRLK